MRYNVAQLLKAPSGQTRQYTLHEDISHLDPDIVPLTMLDGDIQFIRSAQGIFVFGTLRASLELTCVRCLTPFALPLEFTLEEEFRPTIDIYTGTALPLPSDDEVATQIDAHHEIDLAEVIRQNLLLAIPLRPLCRSRCAGLCPICGKNWNDGPCDCHTVEIDPRLEKLRALLDEDEL
jgi:uncharacterized protein